MCRILIVDDDQVCRSRLGELLIGRGFEVDVAGGAEQAQRIVTERLYDLVIIAVELADCDGHELFERLVVMQPGLPVLLVAECGNTVRAIHAIRKGAVDYLVKPLDDDGVLQCINSVVGNMAGRESLVAVAPSSLQTVQLARKVAATPATVLITGESGTGKEVLARFIHDHSRRAEGPFVAVNCAAMPESMLESILFGHEKGAFTGAVSRREGKFEQANGGTLFLDEVAEMPLAQQAKLLRVLQEREVDRLGGSKPVKLDVRVLAATNRDLRQQVADGTFREDLYYRLNVFPLHWAPLRERREDIVPLANALLRRQAQEQRVPVATLSSEAEVSLLFHHWPGNVRELDNVLQRAVVMSFDGMIRPDDLMLEQVPKPVEIPQADISREIDRLPGAGRKKAELQHVLKSLCEHQGHRAKTAAALGISTRMLRYKLARLREMGVDVDRLTFDAPEPDKKSASPLANHGGNLMFA